MGMFDDLTPQASNTGGMFADLVENKKAEPLGQRLNREIAAIPRQVGLTARHGIEGVGDTLDFLSSPIRAGLNAILPNRSSDVPGEAPSAAIPAGSGRYIADLIGLPKPETATERGVGDAARLMAGGGGMLGLASKAANATTGTAQAVSKLMAANPLQQIVSAGAAGGAGGAVRETGGNDASQLLASLAAGIAAPMALNKTQQIGMAAKNAFERATTPAQAANAQIDIHINNALRDSGMTMQDLPANLQAGIRADVQTALKTGGNLSPDAIRRLADYRLTGTTPTAATLTLDPAMVSQQKNLAKLGINSKDAIAQQLGQTENANNRQLIAGLNELGANTSDDALAGGQRVIDALAARNAREQGLISAQYAAARDTSGRSAALDPRAFTDRAGELLHEANVESFLTPDIRTKLNGFAGGDIPLTVEIAEQFKTNLGKIQRNSTDGNVRHALGLVRQALDDTPLLNGQAPAAVNGGFQLKTVGGLPSEPSPSLGRESIDAFNSARRLNREWMQTVDRTPALQAVRDGIEPDKFVQQFIVGNGSNANTMDLAMLRNAVREYPDAMTAIKTQITSHLKRAALNNAADEVGNFSQSSYNKALKAIGDRKLSMFFQPDEVAQLKAIGRVASYEQFQPKGSAVNNSNTAGAAISTILDRIAESPLLSKIPLGQYISGPAQNISVGMRANQAMNVPSALIAPRIPMANQPAGLLMSPAIFGLPSSEER